MVSSTVIKINKVEELDSFVRERMCHNITCNRRDAKKARGNSVYVVSILFFGSCSLSNFECLQNMGSQVMFSP
jgi:hypothetical protein